MDELENVVKERDAIDGFAFSYKNDANNEGMKKQLRDICLARFLHDVEEDLKNPILTPIISIILCITVMSAYQVALKDKVFNAREIKKKYQALSIFAQNIYFELLEEIEYEDKMNTFAIVNRWRMVLCLCNDIFPYSVDYYKERAKKHFYISIKAENDKFVEKYIMKDAFALIDSFGDVSKAVYSLPLLVPMLEQGFVDGFKRTDLPLSMQMEDGIMEFIYQFNDNDVNNGDSIIRYQLIEKYLRVIGSPYYQRELVQECLKVITNKIREKDLNIDVLKPPTLESKTHNDYKLYVYDTVLEADKQSAPKYSIRTVVHNGMVANPSFL